MIKKSTLLEIFVKKPCRKCIVQACCIRERECVLLYRWTVKYRMLIDLNDILMIIFGIIILMFLRIFYFIKLLKKEKANFYAIKIEKVVEENIK